jgi:hypothetical protein
VSTVLEDAMAALHEAERLVASLPPESAEHQTAVDLAAELREVCDQLNDVDGPARVAGARQTVYAAQALLRVIAGRQGQHRAASNAGGGEHSR